MKNDLFNKTLMKKFSKNFRLTTSNFDLIKTHIKKIEEGQFKSEVSNYLYFYDIILNQILGYDREENILFDEKEDEGKGKSEFILKSGDKKFMVVELKDQTTDLDKPQTRKNDKRTPVDQAFDYAQHSGDIDWILVSNFDEFRLYNWHKKGKYISFNSEDLLDKEKFSYFMLSFSKKSYIESDYINKLMEKTIVVERELEKEFYKLYSETRLMLLKEFEELNGLDRLNSIHYAQIILNRYMFICFSEDMGLLPSQISTEIISDSIRNGRLRDYKIWKDLNELFLDINDGKNYEYNKVFGYNGGLFEENLDFIKIRDLVEDQSFFKDTYQKWNFEEFEKDINHLIEPYGKKINPIYRNLLTISSFDFSTELDVNILGHIFENSIGELEELKEDVKSRRKKEGIFYTPSHITDYICRNTIIPYLSKSGNVDNVDDLIQEYSWGSEIEKLDDKLKNIKIVDPACGSGAFLNKATDILLDIHKAIFDIKKGYTKTTDMKVGKGKRRRKESVKHTDLGAYVFDHIGKRREILIDNIFGVDLNEESVEITKLALFLKICKEGLKLPNLDKNIKCGNSLIDDPKYTNNPFNWESKEGFQQIFYKGGFDVVIGNPPYVRHEKIKEMKIYLKDKYKVYTGVADLYVYFFEKGLDLLKENGKLGFISSNKFVKSNYGKPLRKLILSNSHFEKYVDHTYDNIFENVTTYPSVFVLKKGKPLNGNKILVNNEFELDQSLLEDRWVFVAPELFELKNKIYSKGVIIKDIPDLNMYYGIKSGYNDAFFLDKKTYENIIKKNPKSSKIIKKLVRGRDIKRWGIDYKNRYLILTYIGVPIEDYPAVKEHLDQYKEKLQKRSDKGDHWWELRPCDYYNKFDNIKIIYPNIAQSLYAVVDEEGFYTNQNCYIMTAKSINLYFISCLLSSKVLNFVFTFLGDPLQGNYYGLNKVLVEQLPIKLIVEDEQKPFIEIANKILHINKDLINEINEFKEWIKDTYLIEKLSKKLEKYYELSIGDFLDEIRKNKVNIKSRENYQTLKTEFDRSLQVINPLLQKIEKTDKEIDKMVYELYGLTDDEIKLIEENLQ